MPNNIEGLDKLLAQFTDLKDIDREKVGTVGAYVLLGESQKLAPVKTGFLRQSGFVEPVPDKGANLIYGAEYSFYVEWGNSYWAGHPFVRPAVDQQSEKIIQAMKDEVEKEMKDKI